MATLEQFLRTGRLGPIHFGMTQAEAIAHLGQPPDESVQREPIILKYGGLQITFSRPSAGVEPRLVMTGLYFPPPLEPIPDQVLPTDFTGTAETTIADVREYLGRVGLKETVATDGEDASLTLSSGAQIHFKDQKLWSIIHTARTPAAAKKQISISVSEGVWNQLRLLARQSNRSVSELCAQWVTQQANEHQPDHASARGERQASTPGL
jgi:hypothetical protein